MKNFHGIADADASWYYVNEVGNGITSLSLLLGTPEENTHYMLVSIGITCLSKNGSLRFLNDRMAEFIGKFKLMETCEVTKYSAVGNNSLKMFLRLGTKNMASTSNLGAVVLPKRINLIEILASDLKNTIFNMTIDAL